MLNKKDKFKELQTPFYYYDKALLDDTLQVINNCLKEYPQCHLHYAVKANANPAVLKEIQKAGFGVDCVSGGEIQQALDAGFDAKKIVYADKSWP